MDISRDQDSFSPISRQGSILTLCHGLLGRAQPVIPPNLYSLFINIKAWGPQVKHIKILNVGQYRFLA